MPLYFVGIDPEDGPFITENPDNMGLDIVYVSESRNDAEDYLTDLCEQFESKTCVMRDEAFDRVLDDSRLNPYLDILMDESLNNTKSDFEHWKWVANAPKQELIAWAKKRKHCCDDNCRSNGCKFK
jgi:hypothetical protein